VPAAHGFPTEDEGIACDASSEPWINDCDYDAAGALLAQLYGSLKPRGRSYPSQLREFDQQRYAAPGASSLEPFGYVYVPKRCEQGATCRIHVAFHGCRQSTSFVGKAFVKDAGYNEWAESNDIVVLYPQVAKSLLMPLNPQGCWDWWGYTGPDYATRKGPQVLTVARMLAALGFTG
jgi:poly(3-hydroxybutyrate) depolymerase